MVVHGPELFDLGDVAWLMEVLSPRRVIVAGVMARTAAEESGLRVEFNAQPPSRVIRALEGQVFLANRGKTPETGERFWQICFFPLGGTGLVHIECSRQGCSIAGTEGTMNWPGYFRILQDLGKSH